jgi:hypothetical protein
MKATVGGLLDEQPVIPTSAKNNVVDQLPLSREFDRLVPKVDVNAIRIESQV